MDNPQRPHAANETFAQVLAALKDERRVTETEVAKRLGVHVSTVNNWANGKALPRPAAVENLADQYPEFRKRLFDAAGRKVPAPLTPDRRERILANFDRLTEEQQEMFDVQVQAVADSNQT